MKKGAWTLLLCLAYIAVLSGMLMVHIRQIAGDEERLMATLELLLLIAFAVGIVLLYMRRQKNNQAENCRDIPESGNYAENYEQFLLLVSEEGLSEREKEVAWLIYRGFTNRQIAEELFIAETTVKKHVTHIYEKCAVSGRKELKERWRNGKVK